MHYSGERETGAAVTYIRGLLLTRFVQLEMLKKFCPHPYQRSIYKNECWSKHYGMLRYLTVSSTKC